MNNLIRESPVESAVVLGIQGGVTVEAFDEWIATLTDSNRNFELMYGRIIE